MITPANNTGGNDDEGNAAAQAATNTRRDGRELLELAARSPLHPRVRTFPLDQANEALLELKHDRFHGSGVLRVRSI